MAEFLGVLLFLIGKKLGKWTEVFYWLDFTLFPEERPKVAFMVLGGNMWERREFWEFGVFNVPLVDC